MDKEIQVMETPLPGSRIQQALYDAWRHLAWDGGKIEFEFNDYRVTITSQRIVKLKP